MTEKQDREISLYELAAMFSGGREHVRSPFSIGHVVMLISDPRTEQWEKALMRAAKAGALMARAGDGYTLQSASWPRDVFTTATNLVSWLRTTMPDFEPPPLVRAWLGAHWVKDGTRQHIDARSLLDWARASDNPRTRANADFIENVINNPDVIVYQDADWGWAQAWIDGDSKAPLHPAKERPSRYSDRQKGFIPLEAVSLGYYIDTRDALSSKRLMATLGAAVVGKELAIFDANSHMPFGLAGMSAFAGEHTPRTDDYLLTKDLKAWFEGNKIQPPTWLDSTDTAPAVESTERETTEQEYPPIPGDLPKTGMGKLAITAAWQIECETGGRLAVAKDVMQRLQQWADEGNHDPLIKKLPHHAVEWWAKGKPKEYDLGALIKALERWHKSRKLKAIGDTGQISETPE